MSIYDDLNSEVVNNILEKYQKFVAPFTLKTYPRCVMADMFTISIQASSLHYCEPKEDFGPYESYELGFPNFEDPLILPWSEDSSFSSVYPYVPREIIGQMIDNHGGIIGWQIADLTDQEPFIYLPQPIFWSELTGESDND